MFKVLKTIFKRDHEAELTPPQVSKTEKEPPPSYDAAVRKTCVAQQSRSSSEQNNQ